MDTVKGDLKYIDGQSYLVYDEAQKHGDYFKII